MTDLKQTKKKKYLKLKKDDRQDIAVHIINELAKGGLITYQDEIDCEEVAQIITAKCLKDYKLKILTYNINLSK